MIVHQTTVNPLFILVLSMKHILLFICIRFSLLASFAGETVNFCKDWKFYLGDTGKEASFSLYDDSQWRTLNIPHDWSIEGTYSQTGNGTDWQSGFLPAGIGWYRKTFTFSSTWKNKKVQILFEGVYLNSEVWINGYWLGKRPNGYISFVYDLTPYLKEGENQIAVKVDHSQPLTGRWYTGSGIYRPVYLLISELTHIPYSGIHFRSKLQDNQHANYTLSIEIETPEKKTIEVKAYLQAPDGSITGTSEKTFLPSGNTLCQLSGSVKDPLLWSPDSPHIYTLVCQLTRNDKILDECRLPVGFRQLAFSPVNGFQLNGKSLKIKGVCDHHTAGAVGAAVPDDLLHYRLKLLKEMGCNAIRTSHNPFSPTFYTLCDTMGIMVLNEGLDGWNQPKADDDYGNYFNEWWQKDMTDFIKRDRNHPCVILWSLGNEVIGATPEVQQNLVNLFHQLDPDRPVTQGGTDPTRGMKANYEKNIPQLDIIGFNGNGEEVGELERFHQNYPNLCAIATEIPHTYQTRGVYRSKTQWRRRDFPAPWEKGNINWEQFKHRVFPIPDLTEEECFPEEAAHSHYQSSYDNASVRISARKAWQRTCTFPWLMGEFRWGSFDYLGEAEWPQRCGNFGIIDVAAIPKDAYFLYQSLWTDKPMVHILPHWTHPGKEGKTLPIVIYTNCDAVELFVNDVSLGSKTYTGEQLVWLVPYSYGKIEARGRKNGKTVATHSYQSAGSPYSVAFSCNKHSVKAGSDEVIRLEIDVTDKNGIPCPNASNELSFRIDGPLRLLGVDNGAPTDMFPYRQPHCRCFRGKCVLLLQPTEEKGKGNLTIQGANLVEKSLTLEIR